jgi:integrase
MQSSPLLNHRRKRIRSLAPIQVNLEGRTRWKVEQRENGRKRHFFKTEQAALEFIAKEQTKARHLGERATSIPGSLHEDAIRAAEVLAPFAGVSLTDAANFYAKAEAQRKKSKTAQAVADELVANRTANHASTVHVKDLEGRLKKFCETFGEHLVSDITTSELEKWIVGLRKKYSPQSISNFHRVVSLFFSFATPRGYCQENPTTAIDKPKIPKTEKVGVFSPAEIEAILKGAEKEVLPWLALGAFAGLRSAEIDRLDWADVKFDRSLVEVPASKSKTAKRRFVPITPTLAAWLAPYSEHKGSIRPKDFHNRRRRAYRHAGFGKPGTETEAEKAQGVKLRPAPDNALRHSFASYRLAATNDAAKTAIELGHTTTHLLWGTYRELVTPEAAEAYWKAMPDQVAENVLPFTAAA